MIIKFSQLPQLRKSLRNKKVVFSGGTFDLFHRGHIESFKNLRRFGDVVVIGVSSDKRVQERKGLNRPILSEKDRLVIVDSIKYVDYALLAPNPAKNKPVPTIRILAILKPDIFITIDKKWVPFRKNVESLNVILKIIPRSNINSTSRLISKITKRYCK